MFASSRSSFAGSHATPESSYGAKAGVLGLTKSLAHSYGPRGIRVNSISPGYIDTPLAAKFPLDELVKNSCPLQRFGQPEEVADAALELCSDK